MLTCLPRSFCTWDYRVLGAAAGEAVVTFNHFTEQGTIEFGGAEYLIHKHGFFGGQWTLEHDGELLAEARKPSPMFRSFELHAGEAVFIVEAQSTFTRGFNIVANDEIIGTIQPAHPFTRRASIECSAPLPELLQLFSFWLAAMIWRRTARKSQH